MVEPTVAPRSIPPSEATAPAAKPWPQMLRVAWLSIALGLLLELVLVLYALLSGQVGGPQPFLTDLIQKVSWGFIVCVGIALGTTASKAPEAKAGLLGLISAPLGFLISRSLHKALAAALGMAGAVAGVSPLLIGGLKGLQYGLFGAFLAWLGKQAWGRLGAHLGAGVAFGVTFGLTILLITELGAPAPTPAIGLVSRGLNELIFPIGCAAVVYASSVLSKRL
jgi:hypothetical protein